MVCKRTEEVLQIALASYDPKELRVQKHYLEEQGIRMHCDCFCSGRLLLQTLQQGTRYHAVILCSQLEDMDRDTVVEKMIQNEGCPAIIQFDEGRRTSDSILWVDSAKNCYYVERNGLKDLLWELYELPGQQAQRFEYQCNSLYKSWGVQQIDINCSYLTSAACVACGTTQKMAVRKEILQRVSEKFDISVSAVDSGIRRMIDLLESLNRSSWQEFKQTSGIPEEKPTTGKMVYALKQYLMNGQGR